MGLVIASPSPCLNPEVFCIFRNSLRICPFTKTPD